MGDGAAPEWSTPRTGDDVQLELWRLATSAARANHEAAVAQWRVERLSQRRLWRVLDAVATAVRSRSVRRFLRLPLDVLRIIGDARPVPSRPSPPALPPRPVLVTRPSPVAAVRRARRALDEGRPGVALQAAEEALATDPRDVRALDVAQHALELLGEPTRALEFLRRQRAVRDRTWLAAAERRLLGLLVALDPRWSPHVPPFRVTEDGPVLLLTPTPPAPGAGVGADSGRRPRAQSGDPHVVAVHADVSALAHLEDAPLDTAVQDIAWWAARAARAAQPGAVAAVLQGDLRCPIAAWALARTAGAPLLLVDQGPGADRTDEATDVGGEHGRRLQARADQLRAAAAAVVADPGDLPGVTTTEVP